MRKTHDPCDEVLIGIQWFGEVVCQVRHRAFAHENACAGRGRRAERFEVDERWQRRGVERARRGVKAGHRRAAAVDHHDEDTVGPRAVFLTKEVDEPIPGRLVKAIEGEVLADHGADSSTRESVAGCDRGHDRRAPAQTLHKRKHVVYNPYVGFVLVAVGGAAGSCLRYWVSLLLGPFVLGHGFPWATFAVNALGSLGLGLVFILAEDRSWFGADLRLLLGTGLMGGFTTYSAFNLESIGLVQNEAFGRAALYMAGTVAVCLVAGALGLILGRAIRG
ncbi:MAG: fluoride efflux transporter CrcB [Myxococcales bacterium]|nr:fluoride efflux transporter CrcB [Deltaproteobacteria bacterium]NND30813.1 fluoride efflux transporter CrcB [Myxococcales bacterium]MBT8482081.1 fluoride efflux transporter CrcB [Deltaproteobacteria bacterium]NNK41265.1 fluoride efflux transporter CrcB [Myxococcales bacterium]NNL24943.1 fluoride efflux transporter CrcB [Myxococcales bacterium]